jgi:hypothetical protein
MSKRTFWKACRLTAGGVLVVLFGGLIVVVYLGHSNWDNAPPQTYRSTLPH